jgi:superfamily II DNA/RNA helicase
MPKGDDRQTLLFSATLRDPVVMELIKEYLRAKSVLITVSCQSNKRVLYKVFAVPSAASKYKYLVKYMKKITEENDGVVPRTLIFVNRKINTDRVAIELTSNQFPATTIHGDRGQHLREEALSSFRSGKTKCLVATDVCARGVDIKEMDHVINYDLPSEEDNFVQRCGRTGRVKNGVAMSFYLEDEDCSHSSTIAHIIQSNGQTPPEFLLSSVSSSDYNFGEPEVNNEMYDNNGYGGNNDEQQQRESAEPSQQQPSGTQDSTADDEAWD